MTFPAGPLSPGSAAPAPLRVGIVGCGVIGRHHAAVLAAHPRFDVTMLIDAAVDTAERVATLLADDHAVARPRVADSIDAVVSPGAPVDLVVICTPSGTHLDLAAQTVAAGLHTVIEKPLDVDLAKARVFAELAADAGTRGLHVSVISQHRFDAASVAVHDAVTDGRLGRITSAVASVAWWRSQDYYDSGDWRGTWALDGGGAAMNQGVHTVDLLRWCLGRPVDVFAHTALLAHDGVEVEDTVVATVRFASGALAVIHATTAAYPGLTVRLQVHGSRGSAVIDNDRLDYFHVGAPVGQAQAAVGAITGGSVIGNMAEAEVGFAETSAAPVRADAFVAGHRRQYDAIARSIDTGVLTSVSVSEAMLSLALVRAIYLSSTLDERIDYDDVLAGRYDLATVLTGAQA